MIDVTSRKIQPKGLVLLGGGVFIYYLLLVILYSTYMIVWDHHIEFTKVLRGLNNVPAIIIIPVYYNYREELPSASTEGKQLVICKSQKNRDCIRPYH